VSATNFLVNLTFKKLHRKISIYDMYATPKSLCLFYWQAKGGKSKIDARVAHPASGLKFYEIIKYK
jgi:hypothetical protein